jgi:hypothetical protein
MEKYFFFKKEKWFSVQPHLIEKYRLGRVDRLEKFLIYCRIYRGGRYVKFSMNRHRENLNVCSTNLWSFNLVDKDTKEEKGP